uniref:Uncharacterized protein n=1 Tax=Rhizophagus irregularis (strain DAOM 181602 / DAOM 197198 / MUCL 43194) TaxID=747089 RepID=U9TYF4_RHIID
MFKEFLFTVVFSNKLSHTVCTLIYDLMIQEIIVLITPNLFFLSEIESNPIFGFK